MPHASSAPISVPISAAAARPPPSRASCIPFAICFPFVATPRSHTCRRPARLVRLAQPVTFVPPPSAPPPLPSRAAPRRRGGLRTGVNLQRGFNAARSAPRAPSAPRPAPPAAATNARRARELAPRAPCARAFQGCATLKILQSYFAFVPRGGPQLALGSPPRLVPRAPIAPLGAAPQPDRRHETAAAQRVAHAGGSLHVAAQPERQSRAELGTCFRSSVRARLCPRPQARAQAPARTPSRVQPCAARASRSRRARSRCWRGARRTRARGAVRRQPRVPLRGAGAGRQGAVPGGVVELDVVLQCPRAVVEAARWWYQAPQTAASRAEELELAEARHA